MSLEERRAARRRARTTDEVEDPPIDVSDLLSQRKKERQDRLKMLADATNSIEDDEETERKRRERREAREARLRSSEGGAAEEEDTSSRRTRRKAADDEQPPAEETSSRSRRRRGTQDEDESPAAPPPTEEEEPKESEEDAAAAAEKAAAEAAARAAAAEEERKRREKEEEDRAAREAQEAAEAERRRQQQEAEAEKRRQQEEERRKQEEEKREREEQARKEKEEQDRKRRAIYLNHVPTNSDDGDQPKSSLNQGRWGYDHSEQESFNREMQEEKERQKRREDRKRTEETENGNSRTRRWVRPETEPKAEITPRSRRSYLSEPKTELRIEPKPRTRRSCLPHPAAKVEEVSPFGRQSKRPESENIIHTGVTSLKSQYRGSHTKEGEDEEFKAQALAHFREQRRAERRQFKDNDSERVPSSEEPEVVESTDKSEMSERERRRVERLRRWRGQDDDEEIENTSRIKKYEEKRRMEDEKLKAEAQRVAQEQVRLALAGRGDCSSEPSSSDGEQFEQNGFKHEQNGQERFSIEVHVGQTRPGKEMEHNRLEQESLERERIEHLEQELLEHERLEKEEEIENERLEQEKIECERLQQEELERERLEQEEIERERFEQERLEQLEQYKIEQEHLRREQQEEKHRIDQSRLEQEQIDLREERRRKQDEWLKEENSRREKIEKDKNDKQKFERDKPQGKLIGRWNEKENGTGDFQSNVRQKFEVPRTEVHLIINRVDDRKARFESHGANQEEKTSKSGKRVVYGSPNLKSLQQKFNQSSGDDSEPILTAPKWKSREKHVNGDLKTSPRDENSNKVINRWKFAENTSMQEQTESQPPKREISREMEQRTFPIATRKRVEDSYDPPSITSITTKTATFTTMIQPKEQTFQEVVITSVIKTKDEKAPFVPPKKSEHKPLELRASSATSARQRWKEREESSGLVANQTSQKPWATRQKSVDSSTDVENEAWDRRSSSSSTSSLTWREREAARLKEEEDKEEQERLERERKKDEAARRKEEEERKKKGKRKGLGGLSPEKKKLLKKLIMQKAAEDLRNEAIRKAEEKEKYINERVENINIEGLRQGELNKLCKEMHQRLANLHEEVYDWEVKIRKQDYEINELTLRVNDMKGKFVKPVLRKVSKTEAKLAKIEKQAERKDFRTNLKSTGQNKYALEEEKESGGPAWRENLKTDEAEKVEEAAS